MELEDPDVEADAKDDVGGARSCSNLPPLTEPVTRHREVEGLIEGHTAGWGQSQDFG